MTWWLGTRKILPFISRERLIQCLVMCWVPGFDPCKGEIFPFMTTVLLSKNLSKVGKQLDSKALHLPSCNTSSGHFFTSVQLPNWKLQNIVKGKVCPVKCCTGNWGDRCIALYILNLSASKCSMSCPGYFTPRKEPWYTFYWRMGGPQGWSVKKWRSLALT